LTLLNKMSDNAARNLATEAVLRVGSVTCLAAPTTPRRHIIATRNQHPIEYHEWSAPDIMFLHNQSLKRSFRLTAVTLAAAIATTVAGCSLNPFSRDNRDRNPVPVAQSAPTQPSTMADRSAATTSSGPAIVRVSEPVPLAADHPNQYVVQLGDTLWDIAGQFLNDPWYWPEIWYVNPEIENPHLIYPGDVLALIYIDGQPRVTVASAGTFRMSPQARVTPLSEAVQSIPFEAVAAFLTSGVVLQKDQAESLPYLLETRGDHLVAAAGNEIYVRGLDGSDPVGTRFNVVHIGDPLIDPDDNKVVGYQGILVGEGTMRRGGDPATVWLTNTTQEAIFGDRLIPEVVDESLNFFPRAPSTVIDGRIMSVVNGVTQIGQYQVVVLNRGAQDGLAVGDVLTVFQAGETVRDRIQGGKVTLPDESAGTVMVFKVYNDIGYALVMEATHPLHIHDAVRNPI